MIFCVTSTIFPIINGDLILGSGRRIFQQVSAHSYFMKIYKYDCDVMKNLCDIINRISSMIFILPQLSINDGAK